MHFVYIDESFNERRNYVYSALVIDTAIWREVLKEITDFRKQLRDNYGIYIAKELHASEFLSGKGQIANRPILKPERAEIYKEVLSFIADLSMNRVSSQISLFNSVNANEQFAFERLINRINKTMETFNSNALLFFDEGQQVAFTKRIRRMNVFNPIPSDRGQWDTGNTAQNIVISRILEDPIFKDSKQSYFIQLVDFTAYALLRKEFPIPSKTLLGLNTAFDTLRPICNKQATRYDTVFGIIR